ncbi:helix-turn-helix domain-containing protein [Paraburkholderia sp. RL18-085-BIA-A]|uniref:helix-turn-helix domain-containing protein n=2 Tax=unclassified Paraburkholderia TaxID=2615204 RepID=UPI0038BB636B
MESPSPGFSQRNDALNSLGLVDRLRRKLAQTRLSVAEIGEAVGYQSEAAFQRVFKRQVGMTPAQWRARSKRGETEEAGAS